MTTKKYEETIVYFDRADTDLICCPHFYELRWVKGCNYDCDWCYLRGTFFGRKEFKAYPLETTLRHLDRAFEEIKALTIFNAGELSDAQPSHPYLVAIMEKFDSRENKHGDRLLLLTKSAEVKGLCEAAERGRRRRTIYSCTLNAPRVSAEFEHLTPAPLERIMALKKVVEAGISARCRLDPIVPLEGWKTDYADMIREIADTGVRRITIGTPRGLHNIQQFLDQWEKKHPVWVAGIRLLEPLFYKQ